MASIRMRSQRAGPENGAKCVHQESSNSLGKGFLLFDTESTISLLRTKTDEDDSNGERFGGSWKCCIILTVGLLVAIVFTIVVALLSSNNAHHKQGMPSEGASDPMSSVYQHAAVVTDTEICSIMGKEILERGGSAVDALITSQLCIGLVNAQSSGLGGGFFMVIYDAASQSSHFIDARETAPSGANWGFVTHRLATGSQTGINSTAIPGEVRGLWDAHQKYGKLPWEDLFKPIIELADKGYRATSHLEDTLRKMVAVKPLSEYEGQWDIYLNEDESYKREGDLVKNIALANTLRAISVNGSDEFYTGATAMKMVDEVQELGGILTMRDLGSYSTRSGPAVTSPVGEDMILLAPPSPSGGPVLQFIVNVMQSFNLTHEDFKPGPNLVRTYHRFLEASRFAFGLRSRIGDKETPDVQQALGALGSLEYARQVAASIPTNRVYSTNSSYYNVIPQVTTTLGGTSHVSVLAENGDAASSTTSVNYRFGSKVRSPSTGIIYNNDMSDFSYDLASPNYVAPGKRPLSSMCGSIVIGKDGHVRLVEGSAGSKKIITMNAWVILSTMLGQMPLSQAIDGKLIHAELRPEIYEVYESGFDQDMIDQLTTLGHGLIEQTTIFGVIQGILKSDETIFAYSDPRKGGKSSGY
ncbi:glutathione hydrolase 1 proenzyme-like [Lytechinus pictus]|uniref:glutathione hydrolase 1 proenzyme-like n=1 Tax=Lytechinus pictus TaxID=7653 RepID=UPI0030BA10E3